MFCIQLVLVRVCLESSAIVVSCGQVCRGWCLCWRRCCRTRASRSIRSSRCWRTRRCPTSSSRGRATARPSRPTRRAHCARTATACAPRPYSAPTRATTRSTPPTPSASRCSASSSSSNVRVTNAQCLSLKYSYVQNSVLLVRTDAPDISTQVGQPEAQQGIVVKFTCVVDAVPRPAIAWTNENPNLCKTKDISSSRYERTCDITVSL